MRTVIVIPARYGSSRLPGKPLLDIVGKPMIQHVVERALEVPNIDRVVVATDDDRVATAVRGFGGDVEMTAVHHASGTDRLAEVMHRIPADLYVNLQGDEPLVRPTDIAFLVRGMANAPEVQVGTLCHPMAGHEAVNPNTVKVVRSDSGDALYFSRAPIPHPRDSDGSDVAYFKHVGVYAYRAEVLARYAQLPEAALERAEKLEQLRLLAAGVRIRAYVVEPTEAGVDTPACLDRVRAQMSGQTVIECPTEDELLARVRLVITDVDGVLTDGGLFYDETGECLKRFHVRDGLGMRMLEESGIRVAVLSGRDSTTLRKRVADLGIEFCQFGVRDKAEACRRLMADAGAEVGQTACIGDDSIDLPAFEACGLSYAVADAPPYVKQRATRVLTSRGGEGAFREVADRILLAQGKEHVFATAKGFRTVMAGAAQ